MCFIFPWFLVASTSNQQMHLSSPIHWWLTHTDVIIPWVPCHSIALVPPLLFPSTDCTCWRPQSSLQWTTPVWSSLGSHQHCIWDKWSDSCCCASRSDGIYYIRTLCDSFAFISTSCVFDIVLCFLICKGAVPHLLHLLSSKKSRTVDQAVWALGNIAGKHTHTFSFWNLNYVCHFMYIRTCVCPNCMRVPPPLHVLCVSLISPTGDGPELRDMVIHAGIIPKLLQLIRSELPVSRVSFQHFSCLCLLTG